MFQGNQVQIQLPRRIGLGNSFSVLPSPIHRLHQWRHIKVFEGHIFQGHLSRNWHSIGNCSLHNMPFDLLLQDHMLHRWKRTNCLLLSLICKFQAHQQFRLWLYNCSHCSIPFGLPMENRIFDLRRHRLRCLHRFRLVFCRRLFRQ